MILITREREDGERMQATLFKHGLSSLIEPLIEFHPYPGVSIGNNNETFLITSKNAVRSLINLTDNKDYKILAIGQSTANFALKHYFNNVTAAGETAEDLLDYVLKFCKQEKLIYISGKHVSYPLVDKLSDCDVQRLIIYEMLYETKLSKQCYDYLLNNKITGVTFFSLETARAFLKIISQYSLEDQIKKIVAYSLSATVSHVLGENNWRKIYTADSPTYYSLIEMINKAMIRD